MPTFEYIALNLQGKQSRGSIAAESPAAARRVLRNRQLHATKLRSISEAARERHFDPRQFFRARRRRLLLDLTRQLGTMINAEIKLTEALEVLIAQTSDDKLAQAVQNIRDQVISGETLADGLKQYSEWFDPTYVAMVHIGEVTGNLGRSLSLLSTFLAKKQRLDAKIKSALTYPAILVVISLFVIVFLMTVVVPNITRIIVESGREVPGITRFLMGFSDFLISWWYLVLLGLGVIWYFFSRSLQSTKGRLYFDQLLLRIPVLGDLIRQSVVARFTSTLAALIRSGMPMAESLKIVAQVTGNAIMTGAINRARERIIAGADIATPLRESNVVDPAVAHMISVGERTGELESMLVTIAETMEENTDVSVQRISAVIEPLVIVVMAVVVGFIMFATLLPILRIANIGGL